MVSYKFWCNVIYTRIKMCSSTFWTTNLITVLLFCDICNVLCYQIEYVNRFKVNDEFGPVDKWDICKAMKSSLSGNGCRCYSGTGTFLYFSKSCNASREIDQQYLKKQTG